MIAAVLAVKDWLIRNNLPIQNVEITVRLPSHMDAIKAAAAFADDAKNPAPHGISVRFTFRSGT